MQPAAAPPASFALAKIQPPRSRVGLVARPSLEAALARALRQSRLTLLVAPAGYGKTAALTRQIRQLPADCALAWISADEDDQLQRFLACLTTALEPHDLPWRVAPDALATLAGTERGLPSVASEIVNALAAAEVPRGFIVIDDCHRITDPQVLELLQHLLERLPEQWALVVASRVEPPLPLARLRARGELAEFRQQDLRFSESEVDALLAAGDGLDDDRAAAAPPTARELLQRTDGWAAGLRLSLSARHGAGLAPRRGAGDRTQRHLFDYLATEVLDDMPAELREFLLRCSVLPELTAARCAHVSGMPRAAQLLEEVERRGLFVSVLEADELTLRLHDLFRDFLEDRLQREHADELPTLLRRAADNEPDLARAVNHLARAGAWQEAADALVQRAPALLAAGGGPALEQMLALFPPHEFDTRPDLHMLRGLATFPRFDFEGMVHAMQRAAEGYERAGRASEAALARASACLAMQNTNRLAEAQAELLELHARPLGPAVRALVCFSCAWSCYANTRTEGAAAYVADMLEALEKVPVLEVWDRCFFQSLLTGLPGMRPLLDRFAAGALRVSGDAPTQLRAGALHIRTWLALAAGRLDEAAQWLERADEDCRWLGMPRSVMTENWMAHTLIDALRGRREASLAAASNNKRDLEEHALPGNRLTHEYEELFTYLRACWILEEDDTLRELAAAMERVVNPYEWHAAALNRLFSRALVACADGRLDDARRLLEPLAADTAERSCYFPATQARMVLADVLLRLGQPDAAAGVLAPWFDALRSGRGDVGGALLAGPRVLNHLAAADWRGRLDVADSQRLQKLAATLQHERDTVPPAPARAVQAQPPATQTTEAPPWPAPTPADEAARGARPGSLQQLLSEREREVLERMAAGDSNKLIARAFDLSPHTVKRHVANILGKLGVDTRGQAAARWRSERGSAN